MNALDLLRRFEPVILYTQGEMFFPCAVEGYLQYCSLWQKNRENLNKLIVPAGSLTSNTLGQYSFQSPNTEMYLRFVEEPLEPIQYQKWLNSSNHPAFDSAGRLTRVGLVGRMAEALFNFSLLLRGRVEGGTAARAQLQYKEIFSNDPRYVYYGRIIKNAGYTILHYLFFYPMNDWRSSFHGVNDHESDWEQIFIYLTEVDDDYVPSWVAFAAHDFSGDDLRRRWDDPELQKVDDNHVVVFAGAGSHASYILPGEYTMHTEPRALQPLKRILRPIRKYIRESLDTNHSQKDANLNAPLVSLAFIDYARGDGLAIGPQQSVQWSPQLLSDDLPWVSDFRGLWGLDTRDPFGGERAPGGPKFNRDGTIRQTWHDPLGWSGLDKVPPMQNWAAEIKSAITSLTDEIKVAENEIEQKRTELRIDWLTTNALLNIPNTQAQHTIDTNDLRKAEIALEEHIALHAVLLEKKSILEAHLYQIQLGNMGDPQAHLQNKLIPTPHMPSYAKILDFWATISGPMFVLILLLLLVVRPANWPLLIAVLFLAFGMIEAALQNRLINFIMTTTIILAMIGSAVLIFSYWKIVLVAIPLLVFFYSLLLNLSELKLRYRSWANRKKQSTDK